MKHVIKLTHQKPHPSRSNDVCPSARYINLFYSLPKSQSTETCKISASAFNSKSDTGRFCPSNRESAGILISIPAVCNFTRSSTCFIPRFFRASVTRAPIKFRSPSGSCRFFKTSPLRSVYTAKDKSANFIQKRWFFFPAMLYLKRTRGKMPLETRCKQRRIFFRPSGGKWNAL